MNLEDIAAKVANHARLTPHELDFWKRSFRETQQRNSIVAGNVGPDGKLVLSQHFELIFREQLVSDKASISVNVPSSYNHLLIVGSGKVTTATGGNLYAQFNDDTAANYLWLYLQGTGAVAQSSKTLATTQLILGQFSNTGDPVGSSSPFSANIYHVGSNLHKTSISTSEYDDGTTYSIYLIGGKWKSTSPIQNILLYGTDNTGVKGTASIAAGSILSVYGY